LGHPADTVATVAVELNPFEVAVTPDGEHAYVTVTTPDPIYSQSQWATSF
jgi:hypothetical protein